MPLTQLVPPYPIFTDKNGDPLDAGYLYFGEVNENPETNPIQVYYDNFLTVPAAQPLRTSNGYVMRNGSPALIYADSQFSVTVRDKTNSLVIYSPVGYGITPGSSSDIPFNTLQNALRDLPALLADSVFTYSAGIPNTIQVSAGDILRTLAEGFAFYVAPSTAVDQDLITANGVKLYYASIGYAQDQSQYRTGGGAVRQLSSGGGWTFINDANHAPWGWSTTTGPTLSGNNLVVTYDFTATEVGTFQATPDEEYAAIGLSVGASVARNLVVLSGFAPISGRAAGGANGILFSSTSGNVISQTVDQPNGTITVVHAGQTHTDSNGSAVMVSPVANPNLGRLAVASQTKTGFVLQYTRNLSCRIACTTVTPGSEIFTVTESSIASPVSAAWITGTNCVRVTFPSVGNNATDAVVMMSRDAPARYMFTLDSQGPTTCDIFFYDTAGALITAATSSMVFYFMKSGSFPAALPASGNIGFVQRDMVPVNFNLLNGPGANIWLSMAHPDV